MDNLKYLKDYIAEYKSLGEAEFGTRHRASVLLGMGMIGNLGDGGGAGRTVAVQAVGAELQASASLVGRVWPLRKEQGRTGAGVNIGRSQENDIVIPEYSISQKHCEFILTPTGPVLKDLGSSNGTLVGTKKLMPRKPQPLADGDQVVLGRFSFEFMLGKSFMARVAGAAGA